MDSYKVSKAWHHGHSLALDVQQLMQHLPEADEFNITQQVHRLSMIAPRKLEDSLQRRLKREKLECYEQAREALNELQIHLSLARDLRYIERQVYQALADKAIVAHNELSILIRKTRQDIASAIN